MATQTPSLSASPLLALLGIRVPIVQAPMAGLSSPAMAAAVSESGGLGSLGVGAMNAAKAREAIQQFRALSAGPLNINVFTHRAAQADVARQSEWIERLRPDFERYGATPPAALGEIYTSFLDDDDMLAMLVEEKPKVVSFHFGLPHAQQIEALHRAGIVLLGSATNLEEARAFQRAGVDAVVAQGYEAGGHRGMFDPDATDTRLGTFALTHLLARNIDLPVIAAGGIMDGAGIAAALKLGASAAQLGTAFVATDESLADKGYRARLFTDAAHYTVMTRAISGRPARSLANAFTQLGASIAEEAIPDYPIAYDAGKALHAAAKAAGEFGYGAQWAGQGAPLARAMSARALMQVLEDELEQASR
jgi:nitronate monooxygenase